MAWYRYQHQFQCRQQCMYSLICCWTFVVSCSSRHLHINTRIVVHNLYTDRETQRRQSRSPQLLEAPLPGEAEVGEEHHDLVLVWPQRHPRAQVQRRRHRRPAVHHRVLAVQDHLQHSVSSSDQTWRRCLTRPQLFIFTLGSRCQNDLNKLSPPFTNNNFFAS